MNKIRGYLKMTDNEKQVHMEALFKWDKLNTKIALEVLDGHWGNGKDRRLNLERAGFDYYAIQSKINMIDGHTVDKYGIIKEDVIFRARTYKRDVVKRRFGYK
jgi:hypothetical protein